ncbi:hypothetical protein [Streptomyces sp. NPDC050738]|uniref:hypothetical protein n=1 Tax=Streptomyces sp. NPDC050738 TaxID=3154744 RepID=UPI003413052E
MSLLAPRGMEWVVVRTHRKALWTAAILLALSVALLIAVPLWASDLADRYAGNSCPIQRSDGSCTDNTWFIADSGWAYTQLMQNSGIILALLPVGVAVFVAGPLIARELESGTYRMSWTQSASPSRWLISRTALPALILGAGAAVLIALYHWARSTDADTGAAESWPSPSAFPTTGPAGVAYVLLAVALAALAALLVRRTLPAMVLAGAVTGGAVLGMEHLRSHLWPTTYAVNATPGSWPTEAGSWTLDEGLVTADGRHLDAGLCLSGRPAEETACWVQHQVTGSYAVLHPASDFWPLQLVETGAVLAAAALVTAIAFRILRHRAAV